MKVIILRGISGSGKSTWAKNYQNNAWKAQNTCVVCSADLYFTDKFGNYNFNLSKLEDAHKYCYANFVAALQEGYETIIVDNTNTQLWEIAPYITHAKYQEYNIEIIRCVCSCEKAIERNVHEVPAKSIENMYKRIQKIPKHWPKETIIITG